MVVEHTPPKFRGDVQTWADQMVEYLRTLNKADAYRAPQPLLLSHLVGLDGAKAAVDGVLMYSPNETRPAYSDAGAWRGLAVQHKTNTFTENQDLDREGFFDLSFYDTSNAISPKKFRITWFDSPTYPGIAFIPGNPNNNLWRFATAMRYSYNDDWWIIGDFSETSSNSARIVTGLFDGTWGNTDDAFVVSQSGANRFKVLGNGDVQNQNNSYGALSDERLKENVTDAAPKLAQVNALRVVNFNLIGDDLKQIGLLAQEVEKVFPAIVTEDSDGYKGIKYSVLVPILLKAIQELTARVEELEWEAQP